MSDSETKSKETDKSDLIRSLYYNPKNGVYSANKLHQKLNEEYPELNLKQSDVSDVLKSQEVEQLFHKQWKPKHYFPIQVFI